MDDPLGVLSESHYINHWIHLVILSMQMRSVTERVAVGIDWRYSLCIFLLLRQIIQCYAYQWQIIVY